MSTCGSSKALCLLIDKTTAANKKTLNVGSMVFNGFLWLKNILCSYPLGNVHFTVYILKDISEGVVSDQVC